MVCDYKDYECGVTDGLYQYSKLNTNMVNSGSVLCLIGLSYQGTDYASGGLYLFVEADENNQ